MGLFDRNDYGRDYRGNDRDPRERTRDARDRFESRGREIPRRLDYDREMRGRQGGAGDGRMGRNRDDADRGWRPGPFSFAYRGLDDAWSTARNMGAHDTQWDWRAAGGNRYDQDLGPRGGYHPRGREGRNRDRGLMVGGAQEHFVDYDRDYGARGGYGHDFDRARTDRGDPFGDRGQRTPFRVMRGGYRPGDPSRGWYGRDLNDVRSRGWNDGIGDDPAYRPEDFRGRDRGRGRNGPF